MIILVFIGFLPFFSPVIVNPSVHSAAAIISLVDSDNDGLMDNIEDPNLNGIVDPGETDPMDDDSDDDGLLDGNEDANRNGSVNFNETSPIDVDSENDLIQDGTEKGLNAPQGVNTDLSIFIPDQNPASVTDPLDADTDNDSRQDGQEDSK